MCDPKSLVQSGDFVECVDGEIYVAIQRGGEIILTTYNKEDSIPIWCHIGSNGIEIKEIIRMWDSQYNLGDGLRGNLKVGYDVIYEKQDVLELTVKQIEEKFGCKVKIVKE